MTQPDAPPPITNYRLYLIGIDGSIMKAIAFDRADDTAALEEAERRASGAAAELWPSGRLLAQIKPVR